MRPVLPWMLLLAACEPTAEPTPTDLVELVLHTSRCEPDVPPTERFWVDGDFDIAWTTLCRRDDRSFGWMALKVSFWEDRAEDAWNLWFLDPDVDRVTYGEDVQPGVNDPANDDRPDAWRRVHALTPLPSGDYRVEVWGIQDDVLDAQSTEVRITVLGP